ncbi:phage minor head protein [Thalassospira sp. SM2505]
MTTDPRDKAFRKERKRQVKLYTEEMRTALRDVVHILKVGRQRIAAELAIGASEFQAWQLPNIQQSIDKVLREIGEEMASSGSEHLAAAHSLGIDLIEKPLAAGGLRIAGLLPDVDRRQLMAIRSFLTDRLKNVSADVASKVKGQIGFVMIGGQTPADAATSVSMLIESERSRALTIVRTEMGRAFSVASQERQKQAAEMLPGLQKQWRRSGKVHSRRSHDLADGQIAEVDEPFIIGGVELMYPRDPKAPAKETINCGCISLPHMANWEVKHAERMPFSEDEIYRNPGKRDLARELN